MTLHTQPPSKQQDADATDQAVAGVPGRQLFFTQLETSLQTCRDKGQMLGLLVVDIRRFRDINTTFGSGGGDHILTEFVARIRDVLRESDILGRIGDTEFTLILPGIKNAGHAVLAANRITDIMQEAFMVGSQSINIKTAIGIALFPAHGNSVEEIRRHADLALSLAKASNSPYEVYDPGREHPATAPIIMESELRAAIENGELELHLQPQINLRTGKACGAEALVRWHHPTRGTIPPDVFVVLAERNELIMPLTVWTLNAAMRQSAVCCDKWDGMTVSINLSASILHDASVAELISQGMQIWGIDTANLILEVTESAMMVDPQRSLLTLQRLHDLGLKLSIDDFGTGYSSLAYLRRLPVHELKIDKSFVQAMADDEGDATLVRSIIDLGHNFGLSVIAEGVETLECLEALRGMGCDQAQGFYIGRPMNTEAMANWMLESPWAPPPREGDS